MPNKITFEAGGVDITLGEKTTPEKLAAWQEALKEHAEELRLAQQFTQRIKTYDDRAFHPARMPEAPEPRLLINGTTISTPGNLTAITAQSKVGKSALIGAIIAALFIEGDDRDTLGVIAGTLDGRNLIHLDTEQSRYDHSNLVARSLKRAGRGESLELPSGLLSFSLAGMAPQEILELLKLLLWMAEHRWGGTWGVIIDGVADMVLDVNDAKECNELVAMLHGLAINYDCPIIGVIHENPGAMGGKMRGHLGSQFERKAETNLRLSKKDEIVTVWSDKNRGAPILERDGPRFKWSPADGMHMSVQSAGTDRHDTKRAELRDLQCEVFEQLSSMKFTDMTAALMKVRDKGKRTAERDIKEMVKYKIIKQQFGSYYPTTDNLPSIEPT